MMPASPPPCRRLRPGHHQRQATTNAATINANILTRQSQIQAWIAANPAGAVLTAGQTLILAQMLIGLCKLLLAQYSTTQGT